MSSTLPDSGEQQQRPMPSSSSSSSPPASPTTLKFKADPSHPLNKRYYVSCLQSVKLYLKAVAATEERRRQKLAEGEDDTDDDDDAEKDGKKEDEEVIDLTKAPTMNTKKDGAAAADDGISPLEMPADIISPPTLDHSVLGELTEHIDELKELCSGVTASFMTLNHHNNNHNHNNNQQQSTATAATPSPLSPAASSASSSSPAKPFRWGSGGGGDNVLTLACAAFTLEQEALQAQYHREINGEVEDSDSSDDVEEGDTKETESGTAAKPSSSSSPASFATLPTETLEAIALLDAAVSSSFSPSSSLESLISVDSNAFPLSEICTLGIAGKPSSSSSTSKNTIRKGKLSLPSSSSSTFDGVDDVLPPTELMEKQLYKVVRSMCDFAMQVTTHTIKFALQFPPSSSAKKQMVKDAAANNGGGESEKGASPKNHFSQSSTAFSGGGVGKGCENSPTMMAASTTTPAASLSSPPQQNRPVSGGATNLSGSVSRQNTDTNSSCGGGGMGMQQRLSSAIFEDSTAARANLSELTAQLLYHALSVLNNSMLVFKGDAEQDRIVEMLENYVDRCECMLRGEGEEVTAATAAAVGPNSTNNSSKPATPLSYRDQCIIAARRHVCRKLLTTHHIYHSFRRRMQLYLLNNLAVIDAYLTPLVFGAVSRDTELTWFAEGFRTLHVQLLANMCHTNRHVARRVVNAPLYSSLLIGGGGGAVAGEQNSKEKGEAAAITSATAKEKDHDDTTNTNSDADEEAKKEEARKAFVIEAARLKAMEDAAKAAGHDGAEASEGGGGGGGGNAAATTTMMMPLPAAVTPLAPTELRIATAAVGDDGEQKAAEAEEEMEKKKRIQKEEEEAKASAAGGGSQLIAPDLLCSLLQSTGLDQENPAISEWSEFCIKNMCTVSLAARNRLNRLKYTVAGTSAGERANTNNTTDKNNGSTEGKKEEDADADGNPNAKYSYHSLADLEAAVPSLAPHGNTDGSQQQPQPQHTTHAMVASEVASHITARSDANVLCTKANANLKYEDYEASFM